MQNTSNTSTVVPQKGLITDLDESLVGKDVWSYTRNAQMHSHLGQVQFIQNEPSNKRCIDIPYTPIGFIKLLNNRWVVFSTDNASSEIGIFGENDCSYTKIVNGDCLNFDTSYLIKGVSKQSFDCSEVIYWTDGFNPRRTLNLSTVPYTYSILDDTCKTKEYTNSLDCNSLLIERNITIPNIEAELSSAGSLKNGVYQFAIAYAVNNNRVSDYYSLTNPLAIWTHQNFGKSIKIDITNLDRDFSQFELAIIYTIEEVTYYKSLGFHSTASTILNISDVNRPEYTTLSLIEFLASRPKYPYADHITSNDEYLIWAGVRTTPELNYQKQAMNIKTKYTVYQVPADYYEKGGDLVGYNRDEVYSFGIQWLYADGEYSPVYHIPGRKAVNEKVLASGKDVYEVLMKDKLCDIPTRIEKWQVENTASSAHTITKQAVCDQKEIADGTMAYWESSELYPDNIFMFPKDKCTPIRHHKFPDNCKTHIYSQSGKYINILGVKFDSIEHPKDYNGKYLNSIIGYRIVRGDREGNKSIVAKGLIRNVRSYKENNNKEVLYPNYPYNDLRADNFISSKQTYNKSGEKNFIPLDAYKKDKFTFHSPNTTFAHISLGDEINLLTEERANVEGYFENPYKHPKDKLLTEFDLYFALIIGVIDGYMATKGKKCITKITNGTREVIVAAITPVPSLSSQTETLTGLETQTMCDDILNGSIAILNSGETKNIIEKYLTKALKALASTGLFAFFALKTAQEVLNIIANVSPWQQYAMQYNSHGFFSAYRCVKKDNKRRHIDFYQYVFDGLNTVEGTTFNNYKREGSVYLRLNAEIDDPQTIDTSRQTLGEFGIKSNPDQKVNSQASMYYASIKRSNPSQYGQIDAVSYISTGYEVNSLRTTNVIGTNERHYRTDLIFGGDTYISKMSIKTTHNYFSQFLHDTPDGYIYDYRSFRNVGYPRYWIDSTPYDLSSFVSLKPNQSNTPRNKHVLDGDGDGGNAITVVKDKYFYLFNAGIMEFFVESEFNLANRDWKKQQVNFYSRYNQDLSDLFRSDKIVDPEEFVYDKTYSKQNREINGLQQRIDFDPNVADKCYSYMKNRVIYSLKSSKDQKADNWLVYLANNYYDFSYNEFGNITAIQPIDNQQLIFLFDKSSPYITVGRDELQLDGSGKKITLGDGGLFTRDPRPIAFTDFYYGNSQSDLAFVNTQFGSFYPSQRQGRIFMFNGQKLDDITRNGMSYWFKNYLPSKLLEKFPNFTDHDNPVVGTGLISVFDNTSEVYYLTKRDFALKLEFDDRVTYNESKNQFYDGIMPIKLTDTSYFEDASWTVSYSPKDQAFISYHDWHPDWTIQSEKHFFTVRYNTIWKHNDRTDSFCNFYGTDYPFSLEYIASSGQNVNVLRSIEYLMKAGRYFNEGRDFQHILDENFDRLTVYNSEQISGNLKLVLQDKKKMYQLLNYPYINSIDELIEVLYNKEEQKYRVNQFWDITNDRGEFTKFTTPLWTTSPNGYVKTINSKAVNYLKKDQLRKKFRNTFHRVLLTKLISNNKKFIFQFSDTKQLNSFR